MAGSSAVREILAERGTPERQQITAALWDGGFKSEEGCTALPHRDGTA
jgi:hypothetical protein